MCSSLELFRVGTICLNLLSWYSTLLTTPLVHNESDLEQEPLKKFGQFLNSSFVFASWNKYWQQTELCPHREPQVMVSFITSSGGNPTAVRSMMFHAQLIYLISIVVSLRVTSALWRFSLILWSPSKQNNSQSVSLSSQVCEGHASRHLARTHFAYGRCIIASGRAAALLEHVSEVTRARETNRLCKSIKTNSSAHPAETGRNWRHSQRSLNNENVQWQRK